jgi:hypothetical protein
LRTPVFVSIELKTLGLFGWLDFDRYGDLQGKPGLAFGMKLWDNLAMKDRDSNRHPAPGEMKKWTPVCRNYCCCYFSLAMGLVGTPSRDGLCSDACAPEVPCCSFLPQSSFAWLGAQ